MANEDPNHRQRLRERFTNKEQAVLDDEHLLELLLTYAIPQKDVYPLACELIKTFGSLNGVFSADLNLLMKQKGIKEYSATLIKLIDWISQRDAIDQFGNNDTAKLVYKTQQEAAAEEEPAGEELTEENHAEKDATDDLQKPTETISTPKRKSGTGLFGKAMLEEAIKMLPRLPDTDSLKHIRAYLEDNLPFNSAQTRSRNASYIIGRMFPNKTADKALREYARHFDGMQELRDVCYYRFCVRESLMVKITEELLRPSITGGTLKRSALRDYLRSRFPQSKSINDCTHAIVAALDAGGIAKCSRDSISYTYREINLNSFAFILHSEFPDPGIYDIKLLEQNQAVKILLWRSDRLLPALFEMRNRGLISKVSEIDNVRQFTTQYTLEQVVARLTEGAVQND